MSTAFSSMMIYSLSTFSKADHVMTGLRDGALAKVLSADDTDLDEVFEGLSWPDLCSAVVSLADDRPYNGRDDRVALIDTCAKLSVLLSQSSAQDPVASMWRRFGMVPVVSPEIIDGETDWYDDVPVYAAPVMGSGSILMAVEIRDRKLPASSINDKLAARIKKFEENEGREAHRRDIAMLKDEVIAEMLPKAPITRKRVPILIGRGIAFVFSGSPKMNDDIGAYLRSQLGTWPAVNLFENPICSLNNWMAAIINDRLDENTDKLKGNDIKKYAPMCAQPGNWGRFFDGADGSEITIKDEQLAGLDATYDTLRDQGRDLEPTSIDVAFHPNGRTRPPVILRMSDTMAIKKIDVKEYLNEDMGAMLQDHLDPDLANTLEEAPMSLVTEASSLWFMDDFLHRFVDYLCHGYNPLLDPNDAGKAYRQANIQWDEMEPESDDDEGEYDDEL